MRSTFSCCRKENEYEQSLADLRTVAYQRAKVLTVVDTGLLCLLKDFGHFCRQ